MNLYFFGVWPGWGAGHHVRTPRGGTNDRLPGCPWRYGVRLPHVDARDHLDEQRIWAMLATTETPNGWREQPEQVWAYRQEEGWSMLACWDRAEDPRHGSVAVFLADAPMPIEALEAAARSAFPRKWAQLDDRARFLGLPQGSMCLAI